MKRHLLLPFAMLAAVACLVGAGSAAAADGPVNAKHFFWGQGQTPAADTAGSLQNDLIWHGGSAGPDAVGVLTKPKAYLVFWGTEWAQGFQTADSDGKLYSSKSLQNYIASFVSGLGGSAYAGIQDQYCRSGILPGATSCVGGSDFVTNPRRQLGGVWTDPTPVPSDIITLGLAENLVDDPLAMEAQRATGHFGYDPNALYIIITPPTPIGTGQPVYCGYHSQTTSIDGLGNPDRVQYAFIPWQNLGWPGLGQDCGMHNVNATSNSFGNGVFDSWSIVIGHEYEEAVTDPDNFFGTQDGWNDNQTSENGDKCAWIDTQNITLGRHQFAVQPMWSNAAFDATGNGCVVK